MPNPNLLVKFRVDHNELSGPVPDIHGTLIVDYQESALCPNHLDPHTTTQMLLDWNHAANLSFPLFTPNWYAGCDDWIYVQGFQ
jgi:hypothetical protein